MPRAAFRGASSTQTRSWKRTRGEQTDTPDGWSRNSPGIGRFLLRCSSDGAPITSAWRATGLALGRGSAGGFLAASAAQVARAYSSTRNGCGPLPPGGGPHLALVSVAFVNRSASHAKLEQQRNGKP